ncbi:MAG: glycosyltransferase [Deltaproteobacteria bacterium]|nr:glycosyltransferase [Deltaproteobacteria bacterium]
MAKGPFLAVITASINSAPTIRKTLQSLKEQGFQDFEHTVIDGGSQDGTVEILRKFEDQYNLQWISEPDKGIADALNKGLSKTSGEYVLVLQADDYLTDASVLEKVFPLLGEERFDIYAFPVILDHPAKGRILLKPMAVPWWNHFKTIFRHQGTFVHRRVFDLIGGFREAFSIALDYDFFYRALKSGCTVKFEPGPPIAVMGGKGISANQSFLLKRLKEEAMVQDLNESRFLWRCLQYIFRIFYFPYKARILPSLRGLSSHAD